MRKKTRSTREKENMKKRKKKKKKKKTNLKYLILNIKIHNLKGVKEITRKKWKKSVLFVLLNCASTFTF